MNKNRNIAIIAGIILILGMVAGALSVVPSVEDSDYLTKVSANKNQVLTGALFQFIMTLTYIGFALLLYPILKKYSKGLALGFVNLKFVAGIFNLIGMLLLPLFILLSQEFIKVGTSDLVYFQLLGGLLKLGRDLINHIGVVLTSSLGSLMLYTIFHKTKLVPRWLSNWGFVGVAFAILASFLFLFGIISIVTSTYLILLVPLALQEMVLAIWLVAKGFDFSVIDSK